MCAIMCRCDNCHTSPLKMPQNTAKKNTAKNGETLEATGIPNDFKGSLFVMHRKEGGEPTSMWYIEKYDSNHIIQSLHMQSHMSRKLKTVHAFWQKMRIQRERNLPFLQNSNFETMDCHWRFTLKWRFSPKSVNLFLGVVCTKKIT